MIAIRETGPLSVRCILQGAKAKPHTILEKSIKDSSLRRGYGDQAANMLAGRGERTASGDKHTEQYT